MQKISSQTKPNVLDAKEAGKILRDKRKTLGLTLMEVAAKTTVPSHSYLASLEVGRIAIGRSKHLSSLAEVLGLSDHEIANIAGRIPTEGQANLTEAILLKDLKDTAQDEEQDDGQDRTTDQSDPRNARRLNFATVLAGNWDHRAITAYTLDADPHEVLVVDPTQQHLEAGRHYLVLDQSGQTFARTQCIQNGEGLRLLRGTTVLEDDTFMMMGRILFEARAL